jgi:hypothetical protein
MILYLVRTSGGAEQDGGEPDGERHGALDLDPQTQMNLNPIWMGTLTIRICVGFFLMILKLGYIQVALNKQAVSQMENGMECYIWIHRPK